jgi:uncharacterized protein (DUF1330 family)
MHILIGLDGDSERLSNPNTKEHTHMSTDSAPRVPAYSITEAEILDAEGAKRYAELAQAAIAHYGGRYLVRGAEPIVAEGDWPSHQRVVVLEFPSMDQLRAWYDSAEYARARSVARSALRRRLLFVDGVDSTAMARG